jgi:hypothetical protein
LSPSQRGNKLLKMEFFFSKLTFWRHTMKVAQNLKINIATQTSDIYVMVSTLIFYVLLFVEKIM